MPSASLNQRFRAVLVAGMLAALFALMTALQWRNEEAAERIRVDFAAKQAGLRLEQLLTSHLDAALVVAKHIAASGRIDEAEFLAMAGPLHEVYPAFQALNWVDADGVIRIVTPREHNAKALGKELLGPDSLVRAYVEASRREMKMKMTHVLQLYQGMPGFAAYLPVEAHGKFLGWVNAVFAFREFIETRYVGTTLEGAELALAMPADKEPVYTRGKVSTSYQGTYLVTAGEKAWELRLRMAPRPEFAATRWWSFAMLGAGLLASLLVGWLYHRTLVALASLKETLRRERLDNALLNLLSHDLANTVMIVGYRLQSLAKIVSDAPAGIVRDLKETVAKQGEVLRRVRELRAVDRGKIRVQAQATAVSEMMEDLRRMFAEHAAAKGVELTIAPTPEGATVMVDRPLFQASVLNNVVSNALKFSEPGGKIEVYCVRSDGGCTIEVRDHGVGMSEERVRELFDEKKQSSTTGTAGERGSGLGLLQVKAYVELFGGSVAVKSREKGAEKDHGTVVRVTLPTAEAS